MSDSACKFPHKREFILCAYVYAISVSADPLRELTCTPDSQRTRVYMSCMYRP